MVTSLYSLGDYEIKIDGAYAKSGSASGKIELDLSDSYKLIQVDTTSADGNTIYRNNYKLQN